MSLFINHRSQQQGYTDIPSCEEDGMSTRRNHPQTSHGSSDSRRFIKAFICMVVGSAFVYFLSSTSMKGEHVGGYVEARMVKSDPYAIEGKSKQSTEVTISQGTLEGQKLKAPEAKSRCEWVVNIFTDHDRGKSKEELQEQYEIQSQDSNIFYRATAEIFWFDFVQNGWGELVQFENIGINPVHADGTPIQKKSTWTWITGDQHLSNFGAWRNRHREVVFSVNDFDEAAVYDFQVDVLRIAVSVCSHAFTNGLKKHEVDHVLRAFTDTYVETLVNYVGSDKELLFELTPETASGALQTYLADLKNGKSTEQQLEKFTEMDEQGNRRFIYSKKTRLSPVDDKTLQMIRDQFTIDKYGATMMKMGWHVRNWDDDFFEVLDVAARLYSGIGSYGVDRYYVLLKGTDDTLQDGTDGNAVILDVKYEPPGAVTRILSESDAAWYDIMFINDAHRAVEAQRRLTSYVDPFTGWVVMDDKPFVVRQRSPWKGSFDLDTLKEGDDFINFMEQVAVATATSHARGTLSKSPGQFKHVISAVLQHWADREIWGNAITKVAHEYRKQVLEDFDCFKEYVKKNFE